MDYFTMLYNMKNLIIDPLSHAPHLKHVIDNNIYVTKEKRDGYLNGGFYSISELLSNFNINL